jgi:hypothetical protein
MVVLDASMLLLFFRPETGVPRDAHGKPVAKAADRVKHLIEELDKQGTRIAVPAPALSEILVHAGAAASQLIVNEMGKVYKFSVEPFDQRAAIELAAMLRDELPGGKKGMKAGTETWAKLKFDRQIVAIAKVIGATTIYSDDGDLGAVATRNGIPVIRVCDLPLPPENPQQNLDLEFS